jgi:hypothetical protein
MYAVVSAFVSRARGVEYSEVAEFFFYQHAEQLQALSTAPLLLELVKLRLPVPNTWD